MKDSGIIKNSKKVVIEKIIIVTASVILLYLLVSLYFQKHFFFKTVINGVNVSLKAYSHFNQSIEEYLQSYELRLTELSGRTEAITAQDIKMNYNKDNSVLDVCRKQNSFQWISSIFKDQKYYIGDLYSFDEDNLQERIDKLDCLNKDIIEPANVSFRYSDGFYDIVEEIHGNKIIRDRLYEAIKTNILNGNKSLYLYEDTYYEQPKYTVSSEKTLQTKGLLDKYVSARITYKFGSKYEILDGNLINQWLYVDGDLEVAIDAAEVMEYVIGLSEKYDTVKVTRKFKASTGKTVEVKGGLYGWKINRKAEAKALLDSIECGEVIEKEPVYTRKAFSRDEDDIGNTYVEINITRQHLWFYKDGKLAAEGPVVTGNPNKGNATATGAFFLNYKHKNETLKGLGYEVKVAYWMPFYGNMGIHDASWRSSFGGEIYKSKGTHGCVNAPFYLAQKIYENIEDGIPVICYKE